MAFTQLFSIVSLALVSSQVAEAAPPPKVTCADGNVTANAVCCRQLYPSFLAQDTCADAFFKELFPAVAILQENLFDGAQCGEEVFGIIVCVGVRSLTGSIY